MQRRSNTISGWVNFPVDNPDWENSGEGGMVVKLVVCDNRDFDNQFGMCFGASVTDLMDESFIGDDRRSRPVPPENYESADSIKAEQDAKCAWEAYHFPKLAESTMKGVERYLSRPYLAALVIGSTGWSGWHEAEERYWECRFDDLTDEGKVLYTQLESLYKGCDLHLLTFLDT